ncbi:MAG: ABC1 kinase family protein [Oscillospiraceae bacterium]
MKDIIKKDKSVKNGTDNQKSEEQKRLSQIMEILKKYELIKTGLSPEKLRLILEDLGPTFIKLGQVMSMRTDFLPKEYCKELEKLRTDVKPLTIEEVRFVIEQEFNRPIEELFETFDENPLGSASIGQVHMAILKDINKKVVVKVQRPNIKEIMAKDINLMKKAIKMLRIIPIGDSIDFASVVDELWSISQEELDFLVEARHLKEFYENNCDEENVSCPMVENNLTTSKVLVMEFIEGYSISDITRLEEDDINRTEFGSILADNYMKQILNDGFFHADPHPGNIRIRDKKLVWIDMGMMGRLSEKDRKLFKKAVQSVVKKDVNELISVIISMGLTKSNLNYSKLYEDVDTMLEKYCSMDMGDVDLAIFLDEMMSLMSAYDVKVPKGISMLARGIMTIEGVLAEVSPEVNIIEVASKRLSLETINEFDIKKEVTKAVTTAMNSSSKALNIPALLTDLLEATIKGHTKVNLDLTGSEGIMKQLSRMIHKLIIGLIVSSLLIGSSLLCIADNTPKLFDIPLGFIGYLVSIVMGIWLIIDFKRQK